MIAIPSNNSDGNVDAEDISIGSDADTVSADSAKKSGSAIEPGLDVTTFAPDRNDNLLRKNSTLFIRLPTNEGKGFVS